MVKSDGFVMGRRGALRVLGGMAAGLGVGASVQAQTAGGAGGLGGSALQAVGRLFSRPQGNLLIVGGGDTPLSVQQRFVALAGGPENARIAVLPMASSQSDEEAQEVVRDLEGLGARAQVVEIRPADVNSAAVAQTLEKFSGFWFSGETSRACPPCWWARAHCRPLRRATRQARWWAAPRPGLR